MARFVAAMVLMALGFAVRAASPDGTTTTTFGLVSNARVYVTLVPRGTEPEDQPHWIDRSFLSRPALDLTMPTARRNRLEFSILQRDVLARGDVLQLRLASDAHILAQLLSGGQFSDQDDSWIAILGLASRLKLSYTNGPWELSISARHRFAEGNARARLAYVVRF